MTDKSAPGSLRPSPKSHVMEIAPYVGGGHAVPGVDEVHVLSANENPLGPSPSSIAAYQSLAPQLHRYPDGGADALRSAIANRHGLNPECIVCGNGSDELISLLVQAYAGPGDEVLHSAHGFLMYPLAARAVGARPVSAPEVGLRADVDALLAGVTERTRLLFLANPNNPTGSYLTGIELRRLRDALRPDVLMVIDAAYAEYVSRNDYSSGLELVAERDNVVMTRTFSKIYGLAALRLGWCYAPREVVDALHRVRGPFNVNAAAQAAGIAALDDIAAVEAARTHNDQWRTWLDEELSGLGLTVHPSIANFVLVSFEETPGRDASSAYDFLFERGVIARRMAAYGLPHALRLSVGTERECRAAVSGLADFCGGAR